MKFLCVVGARPNFPKISPIIDELKNHDDCEVKLIHTGQHYDFQMSESFFQDLKIPKPDYYLNIGSDSHAKQTANIMIEFEKVLNKEKPDFVIVVGDVNSTVACALVTSKDNAKLVHVEAGLRSFDREMPEEINRVVVDSISDVLFCTEQSGVDNLKKENANGVVHLVGNVMIDTLINNMKNFKSIESPFGIVTLHRPSNVDDETRLREIVSTLNKISKNHNLIWPIHPRTKNSLKKHDLYSILKEGIKIVEPMTYIDFMSHVKSAKFVITDSGGIQEETSYLGIPCLTLRNNTERPITIEQGTNELIKNIRQLDHAIKLIENDKFKKTKKLPWNGKAAFYIVNILRKI